MRSRRSSVPYAVWFVGWVLASLALGLLWFRWDFHLFSSVTAPVGVWLVTARDTREYFGYAWFWWTSVAFLIGSVAVVSRLDLLPSGSGSLRWLMIAIVEAVIFLAMVNAQAARALQDHNRRDE